MSSSKNLHLLSIVGIDTPRVEFPIADVASPALDEVRREVGPGAFALLNPGRGVAQQAMAAVALRRGGGVSSRREGPAVGRVVGTGRAGAGAVGRRLLRAARRECAPPTEVADLVALSRQAALIVSGDTGPLHIAAAVGTPVVALFGPTNPRQERAVGAG